MPLALEQISEEGLRRDVETLASDAFLGRAPGTEGEAKTVTYLSDAFRGLGLAPAGDDGSYLSTVPLLGARSAAKASLRVAGKRLTLSAPDDFVAHSRSGRADVAIRDVPAVFAGYGVIAPEYGWDDFKGENVRGKLVIMLVGDPPVPDPDRPSRLDPNVFKGQSMTYYGRWTYKYEIASALGAAGVLLIHQTAAAGYAYDVVKAGATKEQLMLVSDAPGSRVEIEGWLSQDAARRLLGAAGYDLDTLRTQAVSRDFRPLSLGAQASIAVHSTLRRFDSHNVMAMLPARTDSPLAKEALVVTAHWDHLGHDAHADGDGTFNGAVDNASGVASLLAIAKALTKLQDRLARSVIFLSPTAEESGLLGAKHYANHPYFPINQTVANVNMDCMNLWGRARAIVSVGRGASTLDEWLHEEARAQDRVVLDDPEPEKGYFFRSDHLELMRKGVPALHFLHPGAEYFDRTAEQSAALRAAYVGSAYHKVSDETGPNLRYDGAVEDARLLTRVIVDIAETPERPAFKPGGSIQIQ